ncbi:MAG: hypothetical protein V1660_04260 [archaeon]
MSKNTFYFFIFVFLSILAFLTLKLGMSGYSILNSYQGGMNISQFAVFFIFIISIVILTVILTAEKGYESTSESYKKLDSKKKYRTIENILSDEVQKKQLIISRKDEAPNYYEEWQIAKKEGIGKVILDNIKRRGISDTAQMILTPSYWIDGRIDNLFGQLGFRHPVVKVKNYKKYEADGKKSEEVVVYSNSNKYIDFAKGLAKKISDKIGETVRVFNGDYVDYKKGEKNTFYINPQRKKII